MFAPVPWRYTLKELPLDGQLVWVRRDAWSDRPAVMTWHTATTTFTLDLYSPGGLGPTTLTLPLSTVLCWKFQNSDDQQEWLDATP